MDIMNIPIPDIRTSTILNLDLPVSVKSKFHKDYLNCRVIFLPPSEKTKLCYLLSTGYRTKIPLIFQLLEDPEVDINYKGERGTSIPEELIIHGMNLDILIPQLYKRIDISSEIVFKCRKLKPGIFPSNREVHTEFHRRNPHILNAHDFNSLNSYEKTRYITMSISIFMKNHEDEIKNFTNLYLRDV